VTCALVLSDNPQAVEVLRFFKPDRVFLAYEGRKLLEALKEFNVAVCTYLPFDMPLGVKTAGLLTFLEMCYGEPVFVL
jgi:predicted P-loop ATPase/GTPase